MPFQVEELSLDLIDALAPLMPRIKQRDKDLADQLRRAASSVGLNCAEAAFSDPGNRRARLFTAAGSAGETRHAVRQAVAWRLVPPSEAERALTIEPGFACSGTPSACNRSCNGLAKSLAALIGCGSSPHQSAPSSAGADGSGGSGIETANRGQIRVLRCGAAGRVCLHRRNSGRASLQE